VLARVPRLVDNEVHVWRVAIDRLSAFVSQYEGVLCERELETARRFRFETDRRRYVLSHAALRHLLGEYLRSSPSALRFEHTARGKPELPRDVNPAGLRFNVSHSRELALIAVTLQRDVGVDVEFARPMAEAVQIAERFFSRGESARLRALPAEQQPVAFFNCWTRREAYLKATGEGIAESLDQLEVTFMPGEPARLLSVRGDAREAAQWQLEAFSPGPGYIGALAVRGRGLTVLCWSWAGGRVVAEGEA
jgi:4'-phosphopantetheinyl transferase